MCQCEGVREGKRKKGGQRREKLSDWKASRLGLVEISSGVGRWNGSVWQPSLKPLPLRLRLGTGNLLLWTDHIDLTLSQRTPLCCGGRPDQPPGPNSGQATFTASCTATSLRRHDLSPAYRRRGISSPRLWHSKDFCGSFVCQHFGVGVRDFN